MIIIEFIKSFLFQTYIVFLESSIYIIFGFFLAGLIDVFIKQEMILKYMTGKGLKPIVYASLFGVPLPLCSCGVVPTALALDKKGAQKEAIMSFMISTPETGVDSIILTYGLLGPVFAIFRPIAAFITALIAGIFYSEDDKKADFQSQPESRDTNQSANLENSSEKNKKRGMDYIKEQGIEVYRSGFVKLFDDVSLWILIGIVITGLISAIIPPNFFEDYLGSGLLSMFVMALLGIPLYVCASSSTPIAAALIAKGLNPGAAFVFLLTGPATNATTITVLLKQFGRRFVRIYLGTIFTVSIILGLLFNYLLGAFGLTITSALQKEELESGNFLKFFGVILFIFLLGASFNRLGIKNIKLSINGYATILYNEIKSYRWSEWYKNLGIVCLIIFLVGFYLSTSFFIVKPGEIGITRLFGKVTSSDLQPGLHMKYPYPFGSSVVCNKEFIRKINVGFTMELDTNRLDKDLTNYQFSNTIDLLKIERRISNENESFNLTGDENMIDIYFSIHYRVKDPFKFTFGVENPDDIVRCTARNALIESLSNNYIDEVYATSRKKIEETTFQKMKAMIDGYDIGIDIVGVQLLSVHAPEDVHFAFRDVASASEDKNMMINKAYSEFEEIVNLAHGNGEKSILEAKSYSSQKIADAKGNAENFNLQLCAYQELPSLTKFRLYQEVLQKVLPFAKLYIKPGGESGGDMDLFILGEKGAEILAVLPEEKAEGQK